MIRILRGRMGRGSRVEVYILGEKKLKAQQFCWVFQFA